MSARDCIRPFGERIWTVEGPRVRMMMIPFDTRMTVIEVGRGELWLHSPIEPTAELFDAIDALGEVRYLVAPNKIHSLGIEPWRQRYPNAVTYVSPRFSERHPDIAINHTLDGEPPAEWDGQIETVVFRGSNFLDEVLFFHRPSRTLIVTDLIQRHFEDRENWLWKLVKKSAGVLGQDGGTARDLRATMKDRESARRSAEAVLEWNFDRVIISHGECITHDAQSTVANAFEWALERP